MLIDGINSLFDHWLVKMQSKLQSNIDHYPTKVLKIDYIKNQCDNMAMSHLASHCYLDSLRLFSTGEKMFSLSKCMYSNPNCQYTAMNKFQAFKIKNKDFNTFWVEF